jgi:hypothetical protein
MAFGFIWPIIGTYLSHRQGLPTTIAFAWNRYGQDLLASFASYSFDVC